LTILIIRPEPLAKTKSPMAKVVKVGFVMILFFCV